MQNEDGTGLSNCKRFRKTVVWERSRAVSGGYEDTLGRDDVGEVCCGASLAGERTSSLRASLVAVAVPDSECLADAMLYDCDREARESSNVPSLLSCCSM